MPIISVVVPIYNTESYLKLAIDSILNQSVVDIEVILIDDCSSDQSLQICEDYARVDSRVRVLKRAKNGGIVSALNDGLSAVRGEYIARMDADDISMPERFSEQLDYLRRNPEVGLCGTSIEIIDPNNKVIAIRLAETDPRLVRSLLKYFSPIAHPTWMIRKSVLDKLGGYRDVAPVEDYDFLNRVVLNGFSIGNTKYVGLKYRILPTSISSTRTILQRRGFSLLRKHYQKGEELDESTFARMVKSSAFSAKAHAISERLLQRAISVNGKNRFLYVAFLLSSLLCSPYQARFFFDILRKKMLIKAWPMIRALYRA